ncbi:MAG: hypothetical protein Fur0041_18190 [Bacteroidia bacterium]
MKQLITVMLLLLSAITFAQTENYWVKKSDFAGLKRERAVAFSVNGKGYVGTGVDTAERCHKDLWEYDPFTDTWMQKANLPGSVRRNAVGFTIGDKGYVGLGIDTSDASLGNILKDFWQYNPMTNTWVQKADYPGAGGNGVYFATAFSVDNKGYVCGGKKGPSDYTNELWEYKPLTNSWTLRSNFPGGVRYQLISFVINDKAYIGLGTDYNIYRKDIWRYNPGNNTWQQLSNFPGGERGSACAFTLAERGYVCLGTDGGLKDDLWEFDPYQETWTPRANYGGSNRSSAVAFVVGYRAYVGTGDGYTGKKASMHEYVPVSVIGEAEYAAHQALQVFPNPANDHVMITVKNPSSKMSAALFTLEGKQVMQEQFSQQNTFTIYRNALESGVYVLMIRDAHNNIIATEKVIFN